MSSLNEKSYEMLFELENIITWWKKLATKMYNNVVSQGRIRKELEVWNQDSMNKIDIIR